MVRAVSRLICSCWGFKRGASPKPPRHLRRGDDDQFGRCPSQPDVEEIVEAVAVGRELDENDDLALHALEAADRFEQNVIRLVWDVLWHETVDLRLRGHTDTVRAVILGQDPYPNRGQACGSAFSVPRGVRRPLSLRKIIRTVEHDLSIEIAEDATLDPWASRGVLLLNTALTVLAGCPGNPTHRAVWRPLTRAVLEVLASRQESIAFLLWGAAAHEACDGLDLPSSDVFDAPHPASRYSPADCRSFESHHPFGNTKDRVNWEL